MIHTELSPPPSIGTVFEEIIFSFVAVVVGNEVVTGAGIVEDVGTIISGKIGIFEGTCVGIMVEIVGNAVGSRVIGETLGPFEGKAPGLSVGDLLGSEVAGKITLGPSEGERLGGIIVIIAWLVGAVVGG